MLGNKNNLFTKLIRYISTLFVVTASSSASSTSSSFAACIASIYRDHSQKELSSRNLMSHDIGAETYQMNHLVKKISHQSSPQRIDITSGFLTDKLSGQWEYDNNFFRVIAQNKDHFQQPIHYLNQTNQYRAQIKGWKSANIISEWSGLHAITRYQTTDDLYLASIRYDGYVTIKVKYQGSYSTLAQTKLTNGVKKYLDEHGHLATQQWYKINFSAVGEKLSLSLDGIELLSVHDQLLAQGTIGIRTDNVDAYLDDWLLLDGEKILNKTKAKRLNSMSLTGKLAGDLHYRGQCLQAHNNQGVWETKRESLVLSEQEESPTIVDNSRSV